MFFPFLLAKAPFIKDGGCFCIKRLRCIRKEFRPSIMDGITNLLTSFTNRNLGQTPCKRSHAIVPTLAIFIVKGDYPVNNPRNHSIDYTGDLMAIDMHTHINHGSSFDVESRVGYSADLDDLILMNRAAGIDKMFACTFASCLSTEVIVEENEYMHQLIDDIDCLCQWVVVEPRIEETFHQAEQMLQHKKCVGIKLHPPYHGYSLEAYADKLFSFASRFHANVLIHPNEFPMGSEKDAAYIVPIANKYPKVTFIMAHLGNQTFVDAVQLAVHKNVYIDTSGIASANNLILEYAHKQIGADRILFGTDTYSPAFQRGRIEYAMIPRTDKQRILRDNALWLFVDHLG